MTQPDAATLARHQRIRMRRFSMAVATYAVFLVILLAFVRMGLGEFEWERWIWLLASCALMNFGFWIAFKTGFNLRFADPSLTSQQIVASAWWGLTLVDALPEQYRPLPLMFFLGGFTFGILQLDTRQFLKVVALLMLGYAVLLIYEMLSARADFNVGYELFLFTVYGLLLVWFSLFGGFISKLKRELSNRKKALEAANEQIKRLAITDELTQLSNRRYAMEALTRMTALATRYRLPLSVAIIDIDHFKLINDRFGHAAGDTVLREFSHWLRESLRESDEILPASPCMVPSEPEIPLVARIGGEEFVILLPGTTAADAGRCLERLRSRSTLSVESEPVRFSAGVTSYQAGETGETLLARADRALYDAKHAGRDQIRVVEVAGEQASHP
ncbi:GGDEF domain-containing protein [Andreprevotia chitinilytica]|uniref:GGDEF domain-containing protein n=1 Tax=Andreprevotia chitinilytica TaxID=396808 RepID=UPI00054F50EF|nr:sensor domain-containing diguanylate cyclase [Andreprevotia chitinilytica]